MPVIIGFLGLVILILGPQELYSQSNCAITIDGGLSPISSRQVPENVSSNGIDDEIAWTNLTNAQTIDAESIDLNLGAMGTSETLIANNFNFNVPANATITGISVQVSGSTSNITAAKDRSIKLVNSSGTPIGQNKARRTTVGEPWNTDTLNNLGYWIYGSREDLWNGNWTPSAVNSPSFGVAMQVRSDGDTDTDFSIDQILIKVHFEEPIVICDDHRCVPVYALADSDVVNYSWSTNGGVELEAISGKDNVINVVLDNSSFGSYNVCLTRTFTDGTSESCCKDIIFKDCNAASIGNYVWEDSNANGLQDSGEPGIGDVRVNLYDEYSQFINYTFTDANGFYAFIDLIPGIYVVQIQTNKFFPTILEDSNPTLNSDHFNAYYTNSSDYVSLSPGETNNDIDFGFVREAIQALTEIQFQLWFDTNENTLFDTDEQGAEGYLIKLFSCDSVLIAELNTDANGLVTFTDIPEDDYYVEVEAQGDTFVSGGDIVDGTTNTNCFNSDENGTILLGPLKPETIELVQIQFQLWFDANENILFDTNELGAGGYLIRLFLCDDTFVTELNTDANGLVTFTDIPAGDYYIEVAAQGGTFVSGGDILNGTNKTNCFDADPNGTILLGPLKSETVELVQIDFNLWFDTNLDRIFGNDELPAVGYTVNLFTCNGTLIQTLFTDVSGAANFLNLPQDSYYISVATNGLAFTSGSDFTEANGPSTTSCFDPLPSGTTINGPLVQEIQNNTLDIDFTLWQDTNNDNIIDPNESFVQGYIIQLWTCTDVFVESQITDINGMVLFENQAQGEYYIKVMETNQAFINFSDGDITNANGRSTSDCVGGTAQNISLKGGLVEEKDGDLQIDFNLWYDADGDAFFDSDEIPAEGFTVELYTCAGMLVQTQITDAAGGVWFFDLNLGDYYARVITSGETFTPGGNITDANGLSTSNCFTPILPGVTLNGPIEVGDQTTFTSIDFNLFLDTDQDAQFDTNELPGVNYQIELYRCDGSIITTASTNTLGNVSFTNLLEGEYYLKVVGPNLTILEFSTALFDGSFGLGTSQCISVGSSGAFLEAGIISNSTSTDVQIDVNVWYDANLNAIQEDDEEFAEGILIELFDCDDQFVAALNSSDIGTAWFKGLTEGSFYLKVTAPAGYDFVSGGEISNENGLGTTNCYPVSSPGVTLNVGLIELSSVGDFVWLDANSNGLQDVDEVGIGGVTMTLIDMNFGTSVAVSDNNGMYRFDNVRPSTYRIVASTVSSDYAVTTFQNGSEAIDSDFELISGEIRSGSFVVDQGLEYLNMDLGLVSTQGVTAAVEGTLWRDSDGNLLVNNETGQEGLMVALFDCDGNFIANIESDVDGNFIFEDIPFGEYYIAIEENELYVTGIGGLSQITGSNGINTTDCFTIDGQFNGSIMISVIPMSSMNVEVFIDVNANGINEINDLGYEGIELLLKDMNDQVAHAAISDENGLAQFINIYPGDYYLEASNVDPRYTPTFENVGDDNFDSDLLNQNGRYVTETMTFYDEKFIENIDLGLRSSFTGIVSGSIWRDSNGNKINDSENVFEFYQVELHDCLNGLVETILTDIDGAFIFDAVIEGNYFVKIESFPNTEFVLGGDSQINNSNGSGSTSCFEVDENNQNIELLLGIIPLSTIGDFVWVDKNEDGLQSQDEVGLSDIDLVLFDDSGQQIETATTDQDGKYLFENIRPGNYQIEILNVEADFIVASQINSDEKLNSDLKEDAGRYITDFINAVDGFTSLDIDLGLMRRPVANLTGISGRVWYDDNFNSAEDDTELGIEDIEVNLLDEDLNILNTTFTDADGNYSFSNLNAGTYRIEIIKSDDLDFSFWHHVFDVERNSDVYRSNGLTQPLVIIQDQILSDIDAGIFLNTTTLSGTVWNDANANSIYDDLELGMESIQVQLFDAVSGNLISTQLTSVSGQYAFNRIQQGRVYVQFETVDGFEFAAFEAVINNVTNSNVEDPLTGKTPEYAIKFGDNLNNINAGFIEEIVVNVTGITGRVWLDTNFNSYEDDDELGLEDVKINLLTNDFIFVESTQTDADGNYTFTNQTPGFYRIQVEKDPNLDFSFWHHVNDAERNSDVYRSNGTTVPLVLSQDQIIDNVDAGVFLNTTQISGTVWNDADANSIYDDLEFGMESIQVQLFDAVSGDLIATQLTSVLGQYTFNRIQQGRVYVQFELLNGFEFAAFEAIGNNVSNSNVEDPLTGTTPEYEIRFGDELANINAGFIEEVIVNLTGITGRVWLDANYNSFEDDDELGQENVQVNLLTNDFLFVESTQTDADGNYTFTNQSPGFYRIQVEKDPNLDFSFWHHVNDPERNSDVYRSNGTTVPLVLAQDQVIDNVDAGVFLNTTEISGFVWNDENANGIKDIDEPGFASLNVSIYDDNTGDLLDQQSTDVTGAYNFTRVKQGPYYIVFEKPIDYNFSAYRADNDETINSNVEDLVNGTTPNLFIYFGDQITNLNAGIYEDTPVATTGISGRVWIDADFDSYEDDSELGKSSVTVNLLQDNFDFIASTETNNNGEYIFSDLAPGSYRIQVDIEDTYDFSFWRHVNDGERNSDVYRTNGTSVPLTILQDQLLQDIDAGVFINTTVIGGLVWDDTNANGIYDNNEESVEGIDVRMYDANTGLLLASKTTGSKGAYLFDRVQQGNVFLGFINLDGYTFSEYLASPNETINSNVEDIDSGRTNQFQINFGDELLNLNAGIQKEQANNSGVINGFVWEDMNGDGVFNSGDVPTNDVVVTLTDNFGTIINTTTSAVDNNTGQVGFYEFTGLLDGEYKVEFELNNSAFSTEAFASFDETLDSDINSDFTTETLSIDGNGHTGINAGFYFGASIGDFVWIDTNSDGIQDAGEKGASTYFVKLFDDNNIQVAFAFTDVEGKYEFSGLRPGRYFVQLDFQLGISFSPGLVTDDEIDSDVTNLNGLGSTNKIELRSGMINNSIDIGLIVAPAVIGDFVWSDVNANGVQDIDEPGINDVLVNLYNENDQFIKSTVTATRDGVKGFYEIDEIIPGNYYVVFEFDDDWEVSGVDKGGDDGKDSDIDNSQAYGSTSIFQLSAGEIDRDIDAGLFRSLGIGDFIWQDKDKDGMQDNNEPGVPDVVVSLFNGDGEFLDNVTSDANGNYQFENIGAGDYFLTFMIPDDFKFTEKAIGTDTGVDNDVNQDGTTDIFTLGENDFRMDIDAGLIRPGNLIGGLMWDDEDQDGQYDLDEELIAGNTVWLLNGSYSLLLETQTNHGGRYVFDDVPDGFYYVQFLPPSGKEFTVANVGTNEALDSDVDANGISDLISAWGETVERHVNAGVVKATFQQITNVYPNPASLNQVTLENHVKQNDVDISYFISDVSGKRVATWNGNKKYKAGLYQIPVDLSNIHDGHYTLTVITGYKREHHKLVVLKK